jgi:galactose mutarotase-like enzyme
VKISLSIKNTGDTNMPIAPWLHPYFFIPENKKDEFYLEKNWEKIEEYKKYHWETIYTKNPWKFQAYLWENVLEFDYAEAFQKLWLRSEPGKDFLCIEPTFWDEGALITNPCILESSEEKTFSTTIKKQ